MSVYDTGHQEDDSLRVGTTRPALRQEWVDRNTFWKALAYIERATAWIFFLFHSLAIFRFVVELAAMVLLIWGAIGVFEEFQQREIDRRVRVATLFAQIAQTHALPKDKGLRALKPGVEALAREGVPMHDFDLTGAYLENADLQEVDFTATLLKAALLKKANLRNAQLFRATSCTRTFVLRISVMRTFFGQTCVTLDLTTLTLVEPISPGRS